MLFTHDTSSGSWPAVVKAACGVDTQTAIRICEQMVINDDLRRTRTRQADGIFRIGYRTTTHYRARSIAYAEGQVAAEEANNAVTAG